MRTKNGFSVRRSVFGTIMAAALALPLGAAALDLPATAVGGEAHARLVKAVRHELVMLPYLSVFDNLSFRIEGNGTVVLGGQVVRPTLKSDAGRVVQKVEGVARVINEVEVLPLSRFDDQLRLATYRALFSRPGLDRYAMPVLSPIRIIVRNGDITLVGVVARQADKDLAGIVARGVPGAFTVTNALVVEKS